jgi:small-conductance mechanosensitive channel
VPGGAEAAFDYDELARRLLVQVVRRLAVTDAGGEQEDPAVLQETVTGLEQELASAWTRHGKLAEENIRLREQLKVAQQSLALARERIRELPATADLDRSEVALLQRLLSPEYSGPEFGGGPGSDADARRLLS